MMSRRNLVAFGVFVGLFLSLAAIGVSAEPPMSPDNRNMINYVYEQFDSSALSWRDNLIRVGLWLFWTLALIGMVWTFGKHLFSGNFEIGSFFYEFIQFICFIGFWRFWLTYGDTVLNDIVDSFFSLGGKMPGAGVYDPSDIAWRALDIYSIVMAHAANAGFFDRLVMVFLAFFILIIIGVVAANLLVLLCAGKILCYGGLVYFGFGGCKWTSDIAVNYIKSVLGISIQIFSTLLLISMASKVFIGLAARLAVPGAVINFQMLCAMFVAVVVMGMLVMKVPPMLSGIVSAPTGSIDGISVGQAMHTLRSMADAGIGAARGGVNMARTGANGGRAVVSAHAKMTQNVQNRGALAVAGLGAEVASGGMARMGETAKILGSAMAQNFMNGGKPGGVSGLIDKWIERDAPPKKDDKKGEGKGGDGGDKSGGVDSTSQYVSSVPNAKPQAGGGSGEFSGGSIGGAAVGAASGGGVDVAQGFAPSGGGDPVPNMVQGSPSMSGGTGAVSGGSQPPPLPSQLAQTASGASFSPQFGGDVSAQALAASAGAAVGGSDPIPDMVQSAPGGSGVGAVASSGYVSSVPGQVQSAPGMDGSPVATVGATVGGGGDAGQYSGVRDAIPDMVQGAPGIGRVGAVASSGYVSSVPGQVQTAPGIDGSPIAPTGAAVVGGDGGEFSGVRDAIPDMVQGAPGMAVPPSSEARSQSVQASIDSAMGRVDAATKNLS